MSNIKSILYVEDDQLLARAVMRALTRFLPGVPIVHCQTPRKAIESLTRADYTIVISDYDLIDGKGTEIWGWVKLNKPHIPFLFMSANSYDRRPDGCNWLDKGDANAATLIATINAILGIAPQQN
jgi:DNA-binding NtrC family response regulator